MISQLFFGTGNKKKIEEIQQILGDQIELKTILDLPFYPNVEETETTLQGNAALKARAFYNFTKIPCFADDTGLEVDALKGEPGVFSARYAGPEGNAADNMAKLLRNLNGVLDRRARFRTVIAYFDGKGTRFFEGVLEGFIATDPKGEKGFGYDPIFVPEGSDRTLAEHSADEKNAISHRGKAIREFASFIKG